MDLEHCTILGNDTIDGNSINRCLFNLNGKMVKVMGGNIDAKSENVPESPFFSGGYANALTDIDYVSSLNAYQSTSSVSGVVPRLYCGNLDIYGGQMDESFSTESVSGTYYFNPTELSTFAPTVKSLYRSDGQRILGPILEDDESTMMTGVSSLGTASSPIIKFTSYLTCAKSGVSFGTITFKRTNGDRQDNVITLNISRDLVGIDGIDTVDFMTIGNGMMSGVRTVSDAMEMVSDISQCTITYLSNNNIAISDITKSNNSDVIYVERESGRILDRVTDSDYGRYIELPNDEVNLNFFILFTLKDNVLKYSDDLWCFYLVTDFKYGREMCSDASRWAMDYFRYSFSNFEAADVGKEGIDGSHEVSSTGCTQDATDAFNGCYNATFQSLCWISPALRYADRMFKGCTHATFDRLPSEIHLSSLRSAMSMFERCTDATFSHIETINIPNSAQLSMMFANCTNASFDALETLIVGGDVSKMFYGDQQTDMGCLTVIGGSGTRFTSMFDGCDNVTFNSLTSLSSDVSDVRIEASRMFYGLRKPTFANLSSIDFANVDGDVEGYDGVSMFDGCRNATFESLTGIGSVVDGTRMFAECDPIAASSPLSGDNLNISTFEKLHSLGPKLVDGTEMFRDNYYLTMEITGGVDSLEDGTSMFENTSSVRFNVGDIPKLRVGKNMMSHVVSAIVDGNMNKLFNGENMFHSDDYVRVNGTMDSLYNARTMFKLSNDVYVESFPNTVYDAVEAFSSISGRCDIASWLPTTSDRYCTNAFNGSNNISVSGDVIAGNIVSTSNMFRNSTNICLINSALQNDSSDVANRWYYGAIDDMHEKWFDAEYMFCDVVQDRLLSGYQYFIDYSLDDVRGMFSLSAKVDGDSTFDGAGPLFAKMHRSKISMMDGMFRNRIVGNPDVFVDSISAVSDGMLSFQIPHNVSSASYAFCNCSISGGDFDEIGCFIPSSLTVANSMFDGYDGPKIRFGYGNDGYVYIADGMDCNRMFYGCSFSNNSDDKIGFDIPTIYLNMFEGSDFLMDCVTALDVRDGMNFTSPYSDSTFFYNDMKILGCSTVSLSSLETDILDWFCSDIGDVEGAYLATVVGPVNEYGSNGNLLKDYRIMKGVKSGGAWTTMMSTTSESISSDEMKSDLFSATNNLHLDSMREIENVRGRATCMFSPNLLFDLDDGETTLGGSLSSRVDHHNYIETFTRYVDGTYDICGIAYNGLSFDGIERINAVEMPFMFAGCTNASFTNLTDIGPSPVVGYGAFMCCSGENATFSSLTGLSLIQDGELHPWNMTSRFTGNVSAEWYGNYCNMFAGCTNAKFDGLSGLMYNSKYSSYSGVGGDEDERYLIWYDLSGDVNYATYSTLLTEFAMSLYSADDDGHIHIMLSDSNFNDFVDYDTEMGGDSVSSVDVDFFALLDTSEGNGLCARVRMNEYDYTVPVSALPTFYFDNRGSMSRELIDGYADDDPIANAHRTFTIRASGKYNISDEPKYYIVYRTAAGYYGLDVGPDFMANADYRLSVETSNTDRRYRLRIFNNETGISSGSQYIDTDVYIDPRCTFRLDMTEVNNILTPIVVITDSDNVEHVYQINYDGSFSKLTRHPKNGVVEYTGSPDSVFESTFKVEVAGGQYAWLDNEPYIAHGQELFKMSTSDSDNGYMLTLATSAGENVASFFSSVPSSADPKIASFRIAPYKSNGLDCVIVSIFDGESGSYYKVYKDVDFDKYGEYSFVEETEYNPEIAFSYKLKDSLYFGQNSSISNVAYCSGMFMGCSSATFENLSMISMPGSGSCAGMFRGCSSAVLTGLEYLVLPVAADGDDGNYEGVFSGMEVSSIDLSKLVTYHTNIHELGGNGRPTKGRVLFSGILNGGSEADINDAQTAESLLGLSNDIAGRMVWGD